MKRIKVLADFNGYLPPERQFYIGTITEQFGNVALRHGWKVIEIYENNGKIRSTEKARKTDET